MELENLYNKEFDMYMDAVRKIKWNIKDYGYLNTFNDLIFEGSQGVLLDMDHGIFPHVTYANTTSKNAIEICDKLHINNIETYYVTRAYSTRHGQGLFKEKKIELINNKEEINFINEFQGKFKIGELDYSLLNHALRIDRIYNKNYSINNLVVTCMDQIPKDFKFRYDQVGMCFYKVYESYSPDNKNFKQITNEKNNSI
jgi:adenylosuccinate synthase